MTILKEKCTYIAITQQLKKENYGFCRNIYTLQDYGAKPYRKKGYKIKTHNPRKRYYLRKYSARKSYLNPKKHVRKIGHLEHILTN
jgi:UDP-N-acetylglucosamine:LPS N-acetylglucosamine transferase